MKRKTIIKPPIDPKILDEYVALIRTERELEKEQRAQAARERLAFAQATNRNR